MDTNAIIEEACDIAGCTVSDFLNGSVRTNGVLAARRAAVTVLYEDRNMSYPEIGAAMGKSGHTSAFGNHRAFASSELTVRVAENLRHRMRAVEGKA